MFRKRKRRWTTPGVATCRSLPCTASGNAVRTGLRFPHHVSLAKGLVPLDRLRQSLVERRVLRPSERLELAPVNGVPMVVEWPVAYRHNLRLELGRRRDGPVELGKEELAEVEVRDFGRRADVVDLPDDALREDKVERVGRVAAVEVPSGGLAVAVDDELFAAVEERAELGDDLFGVLVTAQGEERGSAFPPFFTESTREEPQLTGRRRCCCGR